MTNHTGVVDGPLPAIFGQTLPAPIPGDEAKDIG